MLSCGKLIVTNFTLSDIKTIENHQVSRALFMINLFFIFSWVVSWFFLLILPKLGCPINFLVVSDHRMIANFEHCDKQNLSPTTLRDISNINIISQHIRPVLSRESWGSPLNTGVCLIQVSLHSFINWDTLAAHACHTVTPQKEQQ